jgi:hypothetical protein
MASSVPGARDWLHTTLSALSAPGEPLEGVAVLRTGLWRDVSAHDRVIVLNARDIRREWAHLGQERLEETYTLPVAVEVNRRGDDVSFVEDRLWAIVTAVERAVVEDYTMGGAVRAATPAGADAPGEQAGPNATASSEDALLGMLTVRFECMAHVDLS